LSQVDKLGQKAAVVIPLDKEEYGEIFETKKE